MQGVFDQTIITQIQQANDIIDVINEHVGLKKKGREMVGLCPFHDDHRPSLNVSPAKQIFKCFACAAGGDVFKFIQMRENLSFPQAIQRLAERAGINITPPKSVGTKSQKQSPDIDPNILAKVNAWAARYFQNNLYNQQKGILARNYLAERKITTESIEKWQLGLALDSSGDLIKAAKAKNISLQLLQQAGLATAFNQDKFIKRLMFPITDVTGRIMGFGGRAFDQTSAKYINSPATVLFDKSNSLYGLNNARHHIVATGTVVVVEGYTDCIMAHQFGCNNVVATLGTSFTTGHGRIIRRYAKKIILVFDSDTAGIEAANRALEVCLSQRLDIKLACIPEGKDPCDFLLAAGKEKFIQLIENAIDVFQFKWDRLEESLRSDETFAEKKQAIDEYLQSIATGVSAGNLSHIDRGLFTNKLSKIIGLDNKQINKELSKIINRVKNAQRYNAQEQKHQPIDYGQGLFAAAQKELLEVLLNEPKLLEIVKQKISAEIFDVPILSQTADVLFEALNDDINIRLNQILTRTESVEVGRALVELADAGRQKGNFQARLTGAIDVIQRHQAKKRKSQIKATEDQREFLRLVSETAKKENRHNVGMV